MQPGSGRRPYRTYRRGGPACTAYSSFWKEPPETACPRNGDAIRRPDGLVESANRFVRQAPLHDFAVLRIQVDEHRITSVT